MIKLTREQLIAGAMSIASDERHQHGTPRIVEPSLTGGWRAEWGEWGNLTGWLDLKDGDVVIRALILAVLGGSEATHEGASPDDAEQEILERFRSSIAGEAYSKAWEVVAAGSESILAADPHALDALQLVAKAAEDGLAIAQQYLKTKRGAVVEFADVPAGSSQSRPHGLAWKGDPTMPDEIHRNTDAPFTVSADETNITVTNKSATTASICVLCMVHPEARLDQDSEQSECQCFGFGTGYMGNDEHWCYWPADYPDEGSSGPFDSREDAAAHAAEGHECP